MYSCTGVFRTVRSGGIKTNRDESPRNDGPVAAIDFIPVLPQSDMHIDSAVLAVRPRGFHRKKNKKKTISLRSGPLKCKHNVRTRTA